MAETAASARRRRPRRPPFGVLVICALLAFQAVLLIVVLLALLSVDPTDVTDTQVALRAFGMDFKVLADATAAVRILTVVFGSLFALTFVQVVLLLLLRKVGWVLTMLVVGAALSFQLVAIWMGAATDALSLLLYALTALYLNQSDVRHAFGIGAGRVDRALGRSVDAVTEATMGSEA